ncbi:cupin domain-containing protein [Oleomonas cavernae]|uniref:cupin domain-containing protein n=1 Tax=Oleomonas cavernae TaxID=2320859 RepID=UPI0013141F52|nr:cupin domain-containing protein [Oleomonas cavernae]
MIDNKTAAGRAGAATGGEAFGGLVSALLKRLQARSGPSAESLAALYPAGDGAEIYEIRLERQGREWARAHAAGITTRLVVDRGSIEVTAGGERYRLDEGDAFTLAGDVAHSYRNTGRGEAVAYYVLAYGNPPNRA